ncbi:hypothetical protein [Nonomuraea salmonea]|uniref:hypothetical protein n=1 Tax=Nonomuraea salmonea TaxID=46181 RepID=UPI0031EF336E
MLPCLWLVVAVLLLAWPSTVARAAAGPEFLEQDQLSIPLERLAKGSWQAVIVNPATTAVDAEVRVAGAIADALSFKGGGDASDWNPAGSPRSR